MRAVRFRWNCPPPTFSAAAVDNLDAVLWLLH
jgi:hypothetical protein